MVAIAALDSCNPVEQPLPVLKIEESIVAVPAEGGEFTVNYDLQYPLEGVEPTVSAADGCNWISALQHRTV